MPCAGVAVKRIEIHEDREPDVYDINVKPTRRYGWLIMVLISLDALLQ